MVGSVYRILTKVSMKYTDEGIVQTPKNFRDESRSGTHNLIDVVQFHDPQQEKTNEKFQPEMVGIFLLCISRLTFL